VVVKTAQVGRVRAMCSGGAGASDVLRWDGCERCAPNGSDGALPVPQTTMNVHPSALWVARPMLVSGVDVVKLSRVQLIQHVALHHVLGS
jgi:hypothetical protein